MISNTGYISKIVSNIKVTKGEVLSLKKGRGVMFKDTIHVYWYCEDCSLSSVQYGYRIK